MGYYGTCMQVTMIVHEQLLWSVYDGLLWVIRVCPNFIRRGDVFWRLKVTIDNDDI